MIKTRTITSIACVILIFSTLSIIAPSLCAAQTAHGGAPYKMRRYNALVTELISTQKSNNLYQFNRLRRYYSQTDNYVPDGTDIIERMNALAPLIKPQSDAPKDIANFDEFKYLMLAHMGNIDVVENALKLSYTYPNIVNKPQLFYILKGLTASLPLSGDGKEMRTAYDLYTLGEEAALLKFLGVTLRYKSQQKDSGLTYALYKVYNPQSEDQSDYIIYANISVPTQKLEEIQKQEEQKTPPITGR